LDDYLAQFHALTFGNRLRGRWYRWKQHLTAAFYVTKLFMLTYQNILVLRHFRHCRALEPSQKGKRLHFRYVAFYKETFQQSLQLFSPLRTSRQSATEDCKNEISQKTPIATLPPVFHLRPEEHPTPLPQPTRKKGWRRIPGWLLRLRQTPYRLGWKWKSFWQERGFRAKVRALRRQEQTIFIREQHRIAASAQAALFLSLANTIDLKTTKELAVLCQRVSKQRRRKKMTTEDLTCFDQTLGEIDNNYATLLTTVQ
jgi:hypothetical protein